MLDSIVEALFNELLERYPSTRAYGKADLEDSGLPTAVSDCLVRFLETGVAEDLKPLNPQRMRWIDGSDHEVAARFDQFAADLRGRARIPGTEWESTLRKAVESSIRWAVWPVEGITEFVFDETDTLSHDAVLGSVRRFSRHDDLRSAVHNAMSTRHVGELSSDRFRSVVRKADDLRTKGFTPANWTDELEPVYDLFRSPDVDPRLPATFLTEFFADRGLPEAAIRIAANDTAALTAAELLAVLSPHEAPAITPATHEPVVKLRKVDTGDDASGPIPLWKRFQKNLNEPIGPVKSRTSQEQTRSHADHPETVGELPPQETSKPKLTIVEKPDRSERARQPLWQKYQSGRPATDDVIDFDALELEVLGRDGVRERDIFIKNLFDGAEHAYFATMRELSESSTWSDASRVIAENVFKKFQVNIYSEPAVAFTNAVEARFRTKSVRA